MNAQPAQRDELLWRSPDAVPERTIPCVRRAPHNDREGRWFDSFGWDDAAR